MNEFTKHNILLLEHTSHANKASFAYSLQCILIIECLRISRPEKENKNKQTKKLFHKRKKILGLRKIPP